jgi:alkyldihydroxyacetonephosphate synthase
MDVPADIRSSVDPLDLAAAARDLWPGGTLEFWQARDVPRPDRVFWPTLEAEVLTVLRAAAAARVPVVTYGAGSGVCGGAIGTPGSAVLDTKGFDGIGPLDPVARTVEVGAGVIGQQLEDWLAARGFTLGHSPSSIACSSVGGWAAARSAGQFSSRYGVFEDMILSLTAVSASKGVFTVGDGGDADPRWMGLLLGSEGTLAVITRVKLRIWPQPASRWLRGYRFPDVDSSIRAMRRLMQGELWPAVVRLYDPVDTRIGGRTKPKHGEPEEDDAHPAGDEKVAFYREWLRAIDGMPAVRHRTLALPLSLPGVVMRIFDAVASGCLVIVGWEGDPDVVAAARQAGHAIMMEEGEDLGADPGERWYRSRHAVSYKLMPIFERGGFADTMEVACRWSDLAATYDAVRDAIRGTAIVMAHMSHVYPEGACVYFSFAGRGDREIYDRTWNAALEAVLASGATTTHHHGVGTSKAKAASAEVGPAVAGWRAAKTELDPEGLLNPGRVFVDVPHREPPPMAVGAGDGLAIAPIGTDLAERVAIARASGGEPLWPWERLPAPERWLRLPWTTGWIAVEGRVFGTRAMIGRGPRSAAGPDLRPWLAGHGGQACTFAIAADGPRWMGEGTPADPWRVAWELLRSDLRPAALTVRDGRLVVGFRGPAAEAFGALASRRVPGGLIPAPWAPAPWPSGPLERCGFDAADIVAVTLEGPIRRCS